MAGTTLAPGTSDNVNTLNNSDILDGGAGHDTLTAVLGATAADVVAPTLSNIENINVRAVSAGQKLNLGSSTGVQAVTVAQSTSDTTISPLLSD